MQVKGLGGVVAIACGRSYTIALRSDGTVWAWGYNIYGQLGFWTLSSAITIPSQVSELGGITAIACGGDHTIALKSDGTVWTWGHNNYGQLGDGTTTNSNTPVQVLNLLLPAPTLTPLPTPLPSLSPTPILPPTIEPGKKCIISGYVMDRRGNPVESAKIRLKKAKSMILKKTFSDEDGFFEFTDVDADTYIVTALKSGYKTVKQTITLEEGEEKDIEIVIKRIGKR